MVDLSTDRHQTTDSLAKKYCQTFFLVVLNLNFKTEKRFSTDFLPILRLKKIIFNIFSDILTNQSTGFNLSSDFD